MPRRQGDLERKRKCAIYGFKLYKCDCAISLRHWCRFLFFFSLEDFDTRRTHTPHFSSFLCFFKMFSRPSGLAFLAISLCAQAVPHFRQDQCNAISTVIQTVTMMADAPTATSGVGGNAASVNAYSHKRYEQMTDNDSTATRSLISSAISTPNRTGDKNGRFTSPSTATSMRHSGNANNDGRGSATSGSNKTRKKAENNSNDPQSSLRFSNDGQDTPTSGQAKSLTSTNNFINFCLTAPNPKITNGKQITTGSCNPVSMDVIPSSDNIPSSKFTFPKNFDTLKANQTFTIEMVIRNMQTANPKKFVFFKGLNAAAANGKLSATVPNGLNVGFYKLSSIIRPRTTSPSWFQSLNTARSMTSFTFLLPLMASLLLTVKRVLQPSPGQVNLWLFTPRLLPL